MTSRLVTLLIVGTRPIKQGESITCRSVYSCCKVVWGTKTALVQPSAVTSSGANRQAPKAAVLFPPVPLITANRTLNHPGLDKTPKKGSGPRSGLLQKGLGPCQETRDRLSPYLSFRTVQFLLQLQFLCLQVHAVQLHSYRLSFYEGAPLERVGKLLPRLLDPCLKKWCSMSMEKSVRR